MEVINVVSILLVHAVAYIALQVAPTRFLNRAHKVEQVEQVNAAASINKPRPAVGTFGKRYLQRGRKPPRRILHVDDDEYCVQAWPTAADIWTIPSHVPKVKSARILWYLNEFIPAHPDIDSSTVEGRQKLKAIALEEEKGRKPARFHPVSAPKPSLTPISTLEPAPTPTPTSVAHHLISPPETITD